MPDIVHICYPGIGGQAGVATGLAQEGNARGVSQAIIFYGVEPTAQQYLELCNDEDIAHTSILKEEGLALGARRKLRNAIDLYRPQVVIAHHHDTAVTASLAVPGRRSYGLVFVEHHSNALKSRKDWLLSTMAHRSSDHTVYLTEAYREAVQEKLGRWFNSEKTSVIANGLDLSLYQQEPSEQSQGLVIGMQGRMAEGKDYGTLLHAFARLDCDVPISLELAGDGPDRSHLEKLAVELGVSESVHFLGFLDHEDLITRMRRWDIAALCTMGETLSMAILEAWALRLPLLSNNVPGVGDLIRHQIDGWLVSPSCASSLVDGLDRLINDAPLRLKLGKTGRKRVDDEFDRSKNWRQYEELTLNFFRGHEQSLISTTT